MYTYNFFVVYIFFYGGKDKKDDYQDTGQEEVEEEGMD